MTENKEIEEIMNQLDIDDKEYSRGGANAFIVYSESNKRYDYQTEGGEYQRIGTIYFETVDAKKIVNKLNAQKYGGIL